MGEYFKMFLDLLESTAVLIVVAYIITRSRFYNNIIAKKITLANKIYLILIFGLFSIYGTLSGFKILGAIATIRDLGPMIAGMAGGPIVGLGAGLIGGIHRYFMGGFTAVPCAISTILAGLIAGFVYQRRMPKMPGIAGAVALAAGIELLHMAIALWLARPLDKAVELVKAIVLPMVIANGVGIGIFVFIIKNLVRERAAEREKQRIEGELKVARDIQMSIVPKMFPPFPNRSDIDLMAILEPAREVGGDFYDFFFVDDSHLFFIVGDVSGKGVPASLFMAVTITLFKSKVSAGKDAGSVLDEVNETLCHGNETATFVTVFCGIIDVRTGQIQYGNAGHNPPYIVRADGKIDELSGDQDLVLGVLEDVSYQTHRVSLGIGDMIVLYTDGVTEAQDNAGGFFTDKRLVESLQGTAGITAEEMTKKIVKDVHAFAAGAPQSDDITTFALKFNG